jgi:hypothetical protein
LELRTVIGLDLAATFQGRKVGIAAVAIRDGRFCLTSVHTISKTREILTAIDQAAAPPVLLAIDAPLKLPIDPGASEELIEVREAEWDMPYTYRPWEHLIFHGLRREYSISGRPFSSLSLTHRAQVLRRLLANRGWVLTSTSSEEALCTFTEVFPNLTVGILERGEAPSHHQFASNLFDQGYNGLALTNETGTGLPHLLANEHRTDAIICAWTGCLFIKPPDPSAPSAICLGDSEFGFVLCPHTPELETLLRSDPNSLTHRHTTF